MCSPDARIKGALMSMYFRGVWMLSEGPRSVDLQLKKPVNQQTQRAVCISWCALVLCIWCKNSHKFKAELQQ